jgi:hypothetical protein
MDTNITGQTNVTKRATQEKQVLNDQATLMVEEGAKFIPPVGFLGLGMAAIAASAVLQFSYKRKEVANFVGLWVPTILMFGIYNKIVRLEDELLIQHRH